MTENDKRVARWILAGFTLVLCISELCLILWGGEGAFTQAQRIALILVGFAVLLVILEVRI